MPAGYGRALSVFIMHGVCQVRQMADVSERTKHHLAHT